MPLPFLLGVLGAAAGVVGVGGHLNAKEINEQAQRILREAQELYNNSKRALEQAQNETEKSLLKLGYQKKNVLDTSMKQFLDTYDKIKQIQVVESVGFNEIANFTIDQQDALQLREMTDIYSSSIQSGATGAATGAIVALAASGYLPIVTGELALAGSALLAGEVTAAAGIAGSALSFGAAMTPLAAVAAPVVLFTGISASMKADENYEKAMAVYAEAMVADEKMKVSQTLCVAISERSEMFNDLLVDLNGMFSECSSLLVGVVRKREGRIFKKKLTSKDFTEDELKLIAVTRALAGAVKAVIDTPILSKDGNIAYEAEKLYDETIERLPSFNEIVSEVKSADYNARPIAIKDENKPFYKKVWFWIVIIVLMLIGVFSEPSEDTSKNNTILEGDSNKADGGTENGSQIQDDENQGIVNTEIDKNDSNVNVSNTESDTNDSNVNVPNTETNENDTNVNVPNTENDTNDTNVNVLNTENDTNDTNVNVPNKETDTNDSNVIIKEMKEVYEVKEELKSLLALNDGTYVFLEKREDRNYYIVKSTGEEIQLNSFDDRYGCGLSYDAYKNILYLFISDYGCYTDIYIVKDEGTIESVASIETVGGADIADAGVSDCLFFSDGRMIGRVWNDYIIDSNTWDKIGRDVPRGIDIIINDKMYNLKYNIDTYQFDSIEEIDFQENVVREYIIPEKLDSELLTEGQIYRTNKYLYFIGARNGKDYVYRFDGEKWDNIVCLSDYSNHTKLYYDYFCVTEDAIRVFDRVTKTIKEYKLK